MGRIRPHRAGARRALAVAAGAALVAAAVVPPANAAGVNNTSKKLRAAVNAEGMLEHLTVLQDIAEDHGGTRVSGSAGYDDSADYAVEVLERAGYTVTTQDFQFTTFIEHPGTLLRQTAPEPARDLTTTILSYSGSGDVTAPASVPSGDPQGCEPADFGTGTADTVVLVRRGTCPFATKATNAHQAGASAVVVYNNADGTLNGTLGDTFSLDIPVVSATQALGTELVGLVPQGLELQVRTSTFRGTATTTNVLAETPGGDPDNVVMAGAHLDSVAPGPGINDNGSGSASILEVAEQMARVKPTNKLRFALWGAEESGLIGSNHYVDQLTPAERDRIALYLNFDMVASPNYVRFVYDGDNSAFPVGPGAAPGPAGSQQIEQLFHDYFASVGQASAETPFSGRSDYGRFIAYGIPAGGLFTGAEGLKTEQQAAQYGGVAGVAYDPCYHQACDAFGYDFSGDAANRGPVYKALAEEYPMRGNVNMAALEEMGDAIAHAVLTYAFDTRAVNGRGGGHPVSPPGQQVGGKAEGSSTDSGGGLHADHDHEADAA